MPPAARKTDLAICKVCGAPGAIDDSQPQKVLINGLPAAPLSFNGNFVGCCGHPAPDKFMVSEGVPKVRIQKLPAARILGATTHMNMTGPGVIVSGSPNVFINGESRTMQEMIAKAKADAKAMLDRAQRALDRWNAEDRENFRKWFGDDSDEFKKTMQDRINASQKALDDEHYTGIPSGDDDDDAYAWVNSTDADHNVNVGRAFWEAPDTGEDSRAGTLLHESSHYNDVGGTEDYKYGRAGAQGLAHDNPNHAINNADNNEYWYETA